MIVGVNFEIVTEKIESPDRETENGESRQCCRHERVINDAHSSDNDRIVLDEVSKAGTDEFLDTQFEGDGPVLKKIGLVAAATIGLSLAATPAFAAPSDEADAPREVIPYAVTSPVTFDDAFNVFLDGGAALGYGAAAIIGGAYTGIATTPQLIAHSFSCGGGC